MSTATHTKTCVKNNNEKYLNYRLIWLTRVRMFKDSIFLAMTFKFSRLMWSISHMQSAVILYTFSINPSIIYFNSSPISDQCIQYSKASKILTFDISNDLAQQSENFPFIACVYAKFNPLYFHYFSIINFVNRDRHCPHAKANKAIALYSSII